MVHFDDLPRIANRSWLGSLGKNAAERLEMQREIAAATAPLVRGRVLHLPLALPALPETCHEVLVTKARSFEKSPGLRLLLHDLGAQGLFTSEGEIWRRQRKLMAPIFTPHALARLPEMMRQTAARSADQLVPGQTVDLAHEATRIAMTVVGNALFGTDTFDEVDELGDALTIVLGWVNQAITDPGIGAHILALNTASDLAGRTSGRLHDMFERIRDSFEAPFMVAGSRSAELQHAIAVVSARIQELVDQRRQAGLAPGGSGLWAGARPEEGLHRPDLLSRLLSAHDAEEGAMTDVQVRDEIVTLFVAGHETTATSLAWSFYLLARHPELRERVVAEADAFGDGPIERYDPDRLQLTTRVFREVLRLYPPVPLLPRRTLEDVEIGGTLLPRRTVVFVSAWAQHRRADVWDDPDRFDPDRFLPEHEAVRPKGSYLPFGLGPRICIGLHFAMIEGPIVLATLLRRFHFEIDPNREIVEDDFTTPRPRGGVPALVCTRV
jgi:cytochrome P450